MGVASSTGSSSSLGEQPTSGAGDWSPALASSPLQKSWLGASGGSGSDRTGVATKKKLVVTANNGKRYRLDPEALLQGASGATLFDFYRGHCLDVLEADQQRSSASQTASSTSASSSAAVGCTTGIPGISGVPLSIGGTSPPRRQISIPAPTSSSSSLPSLSSSPSTSLFPLPPLLDSISGPLGGPQQHSSAVSFFLFSKAATSSSTSSASSSPVPDRNADPLLAARNHVQKLKTLRHPHIVRYLFATESPSSIVIITEELLPLRSVFSELSLSDIRLGLYQIFSALHFLHVEAGISHNNLSVDSIFVRPTNEWCLGCFEFAGNTSFGSQVGASVVRSHVETAATCRRDTWAIGCLLQEVLANILSGPGKSKDPAIVGPLEELIQRLLRTVPGSMAEESSEVESGSHSLDTESAQEQHPVVKQLTPGEGLTCEAAMLAPFFANDPILQISSFLSNIAVKTSSEKEAFFSELPSKLRKALAESTVDADQVGRIVLPRILSTQALMDPHVEPILNVVFIRSNKHSTDPSDGLMPDAEYDRYVLPHLALAFSSRDRNVRLTLLRHAGSFFPCVRPSSLRAEMFKELLVGLHDKNAELVCASLHALRTIIRQWTEGSDFVPAGLESLMALEQSEVKALLRDDDASLRAAALDHLTDLFASHPQFDQEQSVLDICGLLNDRAVSVRCTAVACLRKLKTQVPPKLLLDKVLPALLARLGDTEMEVRQPAESLVHELVSFVATNGPRSNAEKRDSKAQALEGARRKKIFTGVFFPLPIMGPSALESSNGGNTSESMRLPTAPVFEEEDLLEGGDSFETAGVEDAHVRSSKSTDGILDSVEDEPIATGYLRG